MLKYFDLGKKKARRVDTWTEDVQVAAFEQHKLVLVACLFLLTITHSLVSEVTSRVVFIACVAIRGN